MKRAIFTIVNENYLGKALSLLSSIADTPTICELKVIVVPPYTSAIYNAIERFPEFDFLKSCSIGIPEDHILQLEEKKNVVEYCTSLKPSIFSLFFRNGFESVLYLDPDTLVFNTLNPVFDLLDKDSIVVTPHRLSPASKQSGLDLEFLKYGVYNLGFIGVRNTLVAKKFLDWWSERVLSHSSSRFYAAEFTDQKWIDLGFSYFPITSSKHPGLNVAPWNLSERELSFDSHYRVNSSHDLVFFHFSQSFETKLYDCSHCPPDWSRTKSFCDSTTHQVIVQLQEMYRERVQIFKEAVMGDEGLKLNRKSTLMRIRNKIGSSFALQGLVAGFKMDFSRVVRKLKSIKF